MHKQGGGYFGELCDIYKKGTQCYNPVHTERRKFGRL